MSAGPHANPLPLRQRGSPSPGRFLKWLKPSIFVLCLLPLAWLLLQGYRDRLGANPVEYVIHYNGDWTLRFLLITLAITPLRRLTGWNRLVTFRRMLGLFAFFYGTLHLLTYIVIDQFFDWHVIFADIIKRKYITIGMAGYLTMMPLAWTSTQRWVVKLGGKRWQALHRLIYLTGTCGVVHYWMSVKKDIRLPLMYAVILVVLLGYRLATWQMTRMATARIRRP